MKLYSGCRGFATGRFGKESYSSYWERSIIRRTNQKCRSMGDVIQRRHARFAADMAVRVCAIRGTRIDQETGRMVDVSEGGLCFVGARYLAPGTSVKIEFEDCSLLGEVRHCRMRDYSAQVQFVTGVRIQQVLDGQDSWKGLTQAVR